MNREISRFFEAYDDIGRRIYSAREEDFGRYLRAWLANLDKAPPVVKLEVIRLCSMTTWTDVEATVISKPAGMVGSGRLAWPDDFDTRMGGQMALFRRLASNELDPGDFAFDYFYSGDNNINRTIQEMAEHLFEPHAEELRRHLEGIAEDAVDEAVAPASDRVVSFDHNSVVFHEVLASVEEVDERLRESNEVPLDEKARIHVEIRSGVDLLKAPRTRLQAVKLVLLGALGWLAMEFASSAVGIAAQQAWNLLTTLLAGV